jgi:hypothetical protein
MIPTRLHSLIETYTSSFCRLLLHWFLQHFWLVALGFTFAISGSEGLPSGFFVAPTTCRTFSLKRPSLMPEGVHLRFIGSNSLKESNLMPEGFYLLIVWRSQLDVWGGSLWFEWAVVHWHFSVKYFYSVTVHREYSRPVEVLLLYDYCRPTSIDNKQSIQVFK